jgi:hypothetical protein
MLLGLAGFAVAPGHAIADVACTSYYYAAWSACSAGTQTRTLTGSLPIGCTVGAPALSRACTGGATGRSGASAPAAALRLNTRGQVYTLNADLVANGTAVVITADNVTLDLNGHTITYNAAASTSAVYGVYVAIGIDKVTIRNGTIIQGAGRTSRSPAIFFYGASWQAGPHTVSDMVIRTVGRQCNGIDASRSYSFNNSNILRTYIEVRGGTTAIDGAGADPINVSARQRGGVQIHDNILVSGHRGMQLAYVGPLNAYRSNIYNNRIQQKRSPGSKAPYGILLAKSHNVVINYNQIISDDGRGIILDGWEQGTSEGASGNWVSRNRIDVQYSSSARTGAYVENNVYGIRDRYSSGSNRIDHNIVMVANDVAGSVFGIYIGSDAADPRMTGIYARYNIIIGRPGAVSTNRPYAFMFDYAASVYASDNRYRGTTSRAGNRRVSRLTWLRNGTLSFVATMPVAPEGVQLTRFLDSYLLEWQPNAETDVYEYAVYRDGAPLPISTRGGFFYVDVGADDGLEHTYSVVAVTLAGQQSPPSTPVSTTGARNGWW